MSNYRKGIAAVVGLAVLILKSQGIAVADSVSNEIISALTALAVILVPNG